MMCTYESTKYKRQTGICEKRETNTHAQETGIKTLLFLFVEILPFTFCTLPSYISPQTMFRVYIEIIWKICTT